MLGLTESTEVKRALPKDQLYKKFELKASQCDAFDAFDADVAKMENHGVVDMLSSDKGGDRLLSRD